MMSPRLLRTGRTLTFGLIAGLAVPALLHAGELALQPVPPAPKAKAPMTKQTPGQTPRKYPISPGLKIEPKPPKPEPTVPPFADTEFGAHPTFGEPDDGGRGYLHYDLFNNRYGHWYRPRAHSWGIYERCSPGAFRPRGYGDLFKEPSSCYRMDYSRYLIVNYRSNYGPAYYRRTGDQRCPDYDLLMHHRRSRCAEDEPRTHVWTLGRHYTGYDQ